MAANPRMENGYLIFRHEKVGVPDIVRLLFTGKRLTEYGFVECSPQEMGEVRSGPVVVVLVFIVQKILALIFLPLKWTGIAIEFLLNLFSLNGGLLGLIWHFITCSVAIPDRNASDFRSMVAQIDGRLTLHKDVPKPSSCSVGGDLLHHHHHDDFGASGLHELLDLTMMAAKIAYENQAYIMDAVENHWQMCSSNTSTAGTEGAQGDLEPRAALLSPPSAPRPLLPPRPPSSRAALLLPWPPSSRRPPPAAMPSSSGSPPPAVAALLSLQRPPPAPPSSRATILPRRRCGRGRCSTAAAAAGCRPMQRLLPRRLCGRGRCSAAAALCGRRRCGLPPLCVAAVATAAAAACHRCAAAACVQLPPPRRQRPPEVTFKEFLSRKTTQAFIFCDRVVEASLICVAFRGTEPFDAGDWSTALELSTISMGAKMGRVHLGFMKALGLQDERDFSSGFPTDQPASDNDDGDGGKPLAYYAVRETLRGLVSLYPDAKIVVTGRGAGGALACLFSSLLGKLACVVAHGQPRVGDEAFACYMEFAANVRCYRTAYRYDVVPRFPADLPPFSRYKHFGVCIYYHCWRKAQVVVEVPNKNYFNLLYVVPMYWHAWGDLFEGIFAGWVRGSEFKEGWVSISVRILGLFIPGVASHSPRDYVNAARLSKICSEAVEIVV